MTIKKKKEKTEKIKNLNLSLSVDNKFKIFDNLGHKRREASSL